jgi:hypothetical protein
VSCCSSMQTCCGTRCCNKGEVCRKGKCITDTPSAMSPSRT